MSQEFKTALNEYIEKVNKVFHNNIKNIWEGKEGYEDFVPHIETMKGKKYIRLVCVAHSQRSAYGFVKIEDGSLWKAAGWNGPERNFSRGNIFEQENLNISPYSVS